MRRFRKLAAVVAASIAAVSIAACGGGSSDSSSGEEETFDSPEIEGATELELWTFSELHVEYYQKMAELWNEQNPEKLVQLNVSVLPYDDMHNKLQIAVQSGDGAPDMADIELSKFANFTQGDVLVDLTEYAAPYRDDLVQARLDLYTYDDALYGLDFHVGATMAYYNTALLEEAGIDYTTIETWDDFKEAGSAYYDATGKYFATADTSANWQLSLVLAQLGGDYTDAEGNPTVDTPEMTEALEILKGLQDANATSVPPGGQPDTEEAYGTFNNGDYAVAILPFWFSSRYLSYMPDLAGEVAVAAPPVTDNAVVDTVGGGGTGTAVMASSPNKELAAEYLAFAKLSYEGNVETWNIMGFDPLNTSVWVDEEVTHNPDNPYVQYFANNPFEALNEIADSIGNLESQSAPAYPSISNTLSTITLNEVFESGVPIPDALSQAQQDLENELG